MKYVKVIRAEKVSSYPKEEVIVEEKVDGSQFRIQVNSKGKRIYGSKNVDFKEGVIPNMFNVAVQEAEKISFIKGFIYFCEYLKSNKHNTLKYNRTPKHHIVIYDIYDLKKEQYLNRQEKEEMARKIDLEVVPLIYEGDYPTEKQLKKFMSKESFLGGTTIEGVVVKNYNYMIDWYGQRRPYIVKYVREDFQLLNNLNWANKKQSAKDLVDNIANRYVTVARLNNTIQHIKEEGKPITNEMKDLQFIAPSFVKDVIEEDIEEITKAVMDYYLPKIRKRIQNKVVSLYTAYLANLNSEGE